MKRKLTMCLVLSTLLCLVGLGWGQEAGPSYQHLKFLEPMLGQRQLTATEEGKTEAVGVELAEWVLNKSFVRHDGWGPFDGKPIRYAFVTGWNPKTKQVFQWGAGGNPEIYGFQQRIGTYDPQAKVWTAKAEGVFSNGIEHADAVRLSVVDEKTITLDFTARSENGQPVPDRHVAFSPQIHQATPKFDETPGPGYEQLKPIEWLVGDWKVHGQWADGKPHEGEEHSEWVFNRNFIKGHGWWKGRDGKRVDYINMIAWDPNAKKLLLAYVSSEGSHGIRTGDYDPQTKTIASREKGVFGTGEEYSYEQRVRLVDKDHFEWIGTKFQGGQEPQPDLKITFSRR